MSFRFFKSSCVVVGTFNMYILHPKWLVKKGVIPPKSEIAIETNFSRPGFRYRIEKEELLLIVAPNRLAIESNLASVNCGQIASRVLTELPETPLIAIGSNSGYKASLEEEDSLPQCIRDFPRTETMNNAAEVIERSFRVGVKRDHQVTNIQLSLEKEFLELSVNSHTQLDQVADLEQQHEEAIAVGNRFFEDRESSEELAHHFFGVTIQND